jgi:hypothetical protein
MTGIDRNKYEFIKAMIKVATRFFITIRAKEYLPNCVAINSQILSPSSVAWWL